jgi:hypothetical protein
MATASADQMIVGRLSLPKAGGQLSPFRLPQSFAWLKHFTAEEVAEFFSELLEALHRSQQNGDWPAVADTVDAWQATAEVKADPALETVIGRIIPDLPRQTALQAMADLHRTLPKGAATGWGEQSRDGSRTGHGTVDELRDPWDS